MAEQALVGLAFFVCPLIFFTDLTRNPYVTQIALLNILLLAAVGVHAARSARRGEWTWPRSPLDAPWLAWLGVTLLSWGAAYVRHVPFFRPSIASEGWRVWQFTFVNTFVPFWAGAALTEPGERRPSPAAWVGLAAGFGAAWTLFPLVRAPLSPDPSTWSRVWDAYGGLVWLLGGAGTAILVRGGTLSRFYHAALSAALLAAAYGVLQYFNIEWIWPKVLNPYGGRAVSTFGNPNFMSSYIVLLGPLAFLHFLFDERRRWVYAVALLVLWAALLASLTRSSWVGAAVGGAALFAWPRARAAARAQRGSVLALACALAVVALAWPRSPVEGYRASAVERLLEAADSMLAAKPGEAYAPWHQRVLIWSCAWQMGLESPLIGKGWGLLENFYPFYQGPLIEKLPIYRSLRTHANNAHDELLELFSQTGLLGLGVQIWLWLIFFKLAASTLSRPPPVKPDAGGEGGDAFWSWGLACGALGVLVDNLMNVSMHFSVPAFALWWCVGAAAARASRDRRASWRPAPALGAALAAAVVLLCVWNGWGWVKQWEREVHYFQGFKLVRQGRLEPAARELREAYDWNPREVNNDYELGNVLARLGRDQDAVWAYGEALRSNAGYDEIYFNLATLEGTKLGHWNEALDDYRTAVWINPLSKEAATGLAGAYLREPKANFERARGLLSQETDLFPTDPAFRNNLGYLYSLHGDTEAARKEYGAALRLDPDFELAERNLRATVGGRTSAEPMLAALERRRDVEKRISEKKIDVETLKEAEAAAKALPDDLKLRFYRGSLRLALGRPAESMEDLKFVLDRQPANAAARVNLARALESLGRRDEAQAQYREVLRLEPGNAQARQALGGT